MNKICVLGSVVWSERHLSDQHLSRALAARYDVTYVEPPKSRMGRPTQPLMPTRRVVRPNLVKVQLPGLPSGTRRGVWRANAALERGLLRRVNRRFGPFDAVISFAAGRPDLDVFDGARRGYVVKDAPQTMGRLNGQPQHRIDRGHRRQLRSADVVFTPAEPLADELRRDGCEVVLLPHGVDVDLVARLRAVASPSLGLPAPVAGYVGALSDRVSWDHLAAVVDAGMSLLLAGPVIGQRNRQRLDSLCASARVRWVGDLPYEELAGVLAGLDVGLVPYVRSRFNNASCPLKVFDYIAAGLPVVSTPLDGLSGNPFVLTQDSPQSFASEAASVCGTPERWRRAAEEYVAANTWESRALMLADALGLPG